MYTGVKRVRLFQQFPFGTDLSDEEVVLMKALQNLKQIVARKRLRLPRDGGIRKLASIPASAHPYLERMALDTPRGFRERLLRRAVVYALALVNAL